LGNSARRAMVRSKLNEVVSSLGKPGAPERAAELIASLL
jgi:hypothetical protein